MLKVGDKVVCKKDNFTKINNWAFYQSITEGYTITEGKIYTVLDVMCYGDDYGSSVMLEHDLNGTSWYCSEKFITLKELRKLKIEKICTK